ncbi:unnamed protein product, partial [Rotaria sp. Silwood2]
STTTTTTTSSVCSFCHVTTGGGANNVTCDSFCTINNNRACSTIGFTAPTTNCPGGNNRICNNINGFRCCCGLPTGG